MNEHSVLQALGTEYEVKCVYVCGGASRKSRDCMIVKKSQKLASGAIIVSNCIYCFVPPVT